MLNYTCTTQNRYWQNYSTLHSFSLIFLRFQKMISGVHNCTTWNLCKDIIIHSLAQTNFYYISKIWFQDSTPAQPEIFVDDMVVHYTPTTWLSRHLYNLISGFYTCTTWNLCLYGKVTYFTLHSHTLTFTPFAKHDFRGFFILVVCVFLHVHISHLYLCLNQVAAQKVL